MKLLHSFTACLRLAYSIIARRIAVPLLLLTVGLALVQPCAGQSGTWIPTGSLATTRWLHTATLLQNGLVLVAGGQNSDFIVLDSAELYDPASGTWARTGRLATRRRQHTATLLPNGNVLAAGGLNVTSGTLSSAELYVGLVVTRTDPACNSVISTQLTDFVVNVTDPVNPGTLQGSDFTVNGTPANTVNYTPGTTTMTFHFNSSPVVTQGVQTMHIPAGAFNRASDNQANLEFTCTFCYAIMPLQVTTTVPPVAGTFSPPAPGDYQYDVNFNQAVDPASVQTSDLTLTGDVGGSVTTVSVINGNMTARFTLHFIFGGSVTASIGAGAITVGCNANVAFSGDYTVEGCPPEVYTIATTTDAIIPGGADIGNHCDDCNTQVNLPFPVSVYGNPPISVASAGSNGDIQFTTTPSTELFWWPGCVPIEPDPAEQGPFLNTLFPHYDDLRTDELGVCPDCGIFTQTLGTPPNRQFVIRWKTTYFNHPGTAEFEVLLTEGSDTLSAIYGASDNNNGAEAASGIQQDLTQFTSFSCDEAVLTPGLRVNYIPTGCNGGADLTLERAASVKGPFAIDLPLTGTPGIEDRTGGPRRLYQIVLTFNNMITSVDDVATSCGRVKRPTVDSGDAHRLIVNLAGVTCTAEDVTLTLTGVHDDQGGTLDTALTFGLLVGDVTGNGIVNSADVRTTQDAVGRDTNSQNFRADVNEDGQITRADVTIVKGQLGNRLP